MQCLANVLKPPSNVRFMEQLPKINNIGNYYYLIFLQWLIHQYAQAL